MEQYLKLDLKRFKATIANFDSLKEINKEKAKNTKELLDGIFNQNIVLLDTMFETISVLVLQVEKLQNILDYNGDGNNPTRNVH